MVPAVMRSMKAIVSQDFRKVAIGFFVFYRPSLFINTNSDSLKTSPKTCKILISIAYQN
jgi:hypothetical protein